MIEDPATPKNLILTGLRAVVAKVEELMSCEDAETLYRRAVEFCRGELGLERCAIYVEEDGYLRGTFGTDMHGQTTDERGHWMPLDTVWSDTTWENWIDRLQILRPQDRRWVMADTQQYEWNGREPVVVGAGWVAFTPIQAPGGGFAVLFNDTAISHKELDETKQEIVAIFCSLLGSITKRGAARHVYEEIASKIKAGIRNAVYTDKIPGERDLAKSYQVNFKTINKAVAQLVDEGWLYRLKGRGTFVARNLDLSESAQSRIGFVLPSLLTPAHSQLLHFLQVQARQRGVSLQTELAPLPFVDAALVLAALEEQETDCAVVCSELLQDERHERALRDSRIPIVAFGRSAPQGRALDCVYLDESDAARQLTHRLLEIETQSIVYVGPTSVESTGKLLGYREAMEAAGVTPEERPVERGGRVSQDSYTLMHDLMQRPAPPKGILCGDEAVAEGVERYLLQTRGTAPDVVLGCVVESPDAHRFSLPMQTAQYRFAEVASLLLELAVRRVQKPDADPRSRSARAALTEHHPAYTTAAQT